MPPVHQQNRTKDSVLSPEDRRKTHILVVEDNPVNQKIATANLCKLGFGTAAVWNSEQALLYLDNPSCPFLRDSDGLHDASNGWL